MLSAALHAAAVCRRHLPGSLLNSLSTTHRTVPRAHSHALDAHSLSHLLRSPTPDLNGALAQPPPPPPAPRAHGHGVLAPRHPPRALRRAGADPRRARPHAGRRGRGDQGAAGWHRQRQQRDGGRVPGAAQPGARGGGRGPAAVERGPGFGGRGDGGAAAAAGRVRVRGRGGQPLRREPGVGELPRAPRRGGGAVGGGGAVLHPRQQHVRRGAAVRHVHAGGVAQHRRGRVRAGQLRHGRHAHALPVQPARQRAGPEPLLAC
ncbi:hypothetical protein Zm00014a_039323 [Zea mays]|uniref:Uncharacterized protein n=1 Tax=Zea mays TaxID=4577 RepID=A0A317YDN1_MAIZE|nr:hypothetical protein Zm00014a_039323 [Zea mays]